MIKFFRHIRKKLLKEHKVSKYLLYAIGEIVLVVVGILIALNINNWNESKKEAAEEILILKQLHKEFVADSSALSNVIKYVNRKKKYGRFLKNISIQKNTYTPKDSLIFKIFVLCDPSFYEGNTPTYDEIVASGKLGLISSDEVKSRIKVYKQTQEFEKSITISESQKFREQYNDHVYQFFELEIRTYFFNNNIEINLNDLSKYRIDISGFFEDPTTFSHLEKMTGVESKIEWVYEQRRMTRLTKIIKAIETELKQLSDD